MTVLRCWLITALLLTGSGASCDETDSKQTKPSFGSRQLDQILDDRPDMQGVVEKDSVIHQWVVAGFNGDRFGQRVYWLGDSPPGGNPSTFTAPYGRVPPFIQISAGTELTPVDRWASLIFELHNLERTEDFDRVVRDAIAGKIDGPQYATECVRIEYEASLETKQFLTKHPIPEVGHSRNLIYRSLLEVALNFDEYKVQCQEKGMPLGNYEYFLGHHKNVLESVVAASTPESAPNTTPPTPDP